MHNDILMKVSENTLIKKRLMASKTRQYRFFGFLKQSRFWCFNGKRNRAYYLLLRDKSSWINL